jgi:hypothetical protein
MASDNFENEDPLERAGQSILRLLDRATDAPDQNSREAVSRNNFVLLSIALPSPRGTSFRESLFLVRAVCEGHSEGVERVPRVGSRLFPRRCGSCRRRLLRQRM